MRLVTFVCRAALLAAVGCVVGFPAGCGSRVKPQGEVSGTVKINGQLVTAGEVVFFPEAGGEPVRTGLGPDGTFRATGIPTGRSRVAIETLPFRQLTPPPPEIAKQLGGPRTKYVPIPEKYERPETSGLQFDVKKGVNEEWNIQLSDDKPAPGK
jgi:hypothetical protein